VRRGRDPAACERPGVPGAALLRFRSSCCVRCCHAARWRMAWRAENAMNCGD